MQQFTHCLVCHESIVRNVYWSNLFFPDVLEPICSLCKRELNVLKGQRCKKCSRQSDQELCSDCLWWQKIYDGEDPLEKNVSVFKYNEWLKDVMAHWKYRGDYVLGYIFYRAFQEVFLYEFSQQQKHTYLVPVPLSEARLNERGFNQSEMLASFLGRRVVSCFQRIDSEKQAKKSKGERIKSANPFVLTKQLKKPVILIDDIYTTGRTVRHLASLLKESGCPKVYSYTLIRG